MGTVNEQPMAIDEVATVAANLNDVERLLGSIRETSLEIQAALLGGNSEPAVGTTREAMGLRGKSNELASGASDIHTILQNIKNCLS